MTKLPEHKLTTIADMAAALYNLVQDGAGELPVQVLVVPDTTMQAIARNSGGGEKPALMIEIGSETGRVPATLMSTERLSSNPPLGRVQ